MNDPAPTRTRGDLCPGVVRPWGAADGALVRLRLPGGDLPAEGLVRLAALARRYGDGTVHLTSRANIQVRGLPLAGGRLPAEVEAALLATGLVPSPTHELVRNVLVSPLTGVAGGRADLRPVARDLDRLVCAEPALAGLSARFLFVLDDGRGDVAGQRLDLGAVALDHGTAQLRAGSGWGGCVPLGGVPEALVALAHDFLAARGDGPTAPWHVDELPGALVAGTPDARALVRGDPVPYGPVPTGVHLPAPDGVLADALLDEVIAAAAAGKRLVVTPWRGVLVLEPARPGHDAT
ncbi:nitrite reductase [Marmoricola sp. RAF53]|uniref:nitrite reductase n=1 Tax=Marmoricola sp. RAF53 TaxID=3233059 RepID=UPI003F9AF40C